LEFPSFKVNADALAQKAGSPRHCPHPQQQLRKKIDKTGQPRLYNQCLTCGSPVGTRVSAKIYSGAHIGEIPSFDEELRSSYLRAYFARYDALRAAEVERLKTQCREQYQRYLQTPEWLARRELVLERENRICEGCRSRSATEVHHATYDHIGNEFLFELVALCRACHDRFHESDFPRFLDALYFASFKSADVAEELCP
jgi:hypothetical protein